MKCSSGNGLERNALTHVCTTVNPNHLQLAIDHPFHTILHVFHEAPGL